MPDSVHRRPRASARPLCALAHGFSSRGQRAHVHLQLALRPPQSRNHGPAPGRHRRRAQHRGQRPIHLRGTALAGSRLGRRVQAIRAPRPAPPPGRSSIFAKGLAYRDFTPAHAGPAFRKSTTSLPPPRLRLSPHGSSIPACERCRAKRATAALPAGEPFALRYRVPRGPDSGVARILHFVDAVYGAQSHPADEVEDFALLRSVGAPKDRSSSLGLWDGMPTYHLASCVDDADLRISHIIRGQDHLTNTYKHLLIFEALGAAGAAVRPSAAAGRARRRQALQTQTRPGGQRHHLSRCRLSAPGLRQLPLPPRLVAQERSRVHDPRRDSPAFSPSKASTAPTPWSTLPKKIPSIPKPSGSTPSTSAPCPSKSSAAASSPSSSRPAFIPRQKSSLAVTPAHPRAHQALRDAVSAADFFFVSELAPYDPAELIPLKKGIDGRRRYGSARSRDRAASARHNQFRPRFARQSAARSCRARSASRPGRCFNPFASPSADAKTRRRFLKP